VVGIMESDYAGDIDETAAALDNGLGTNASAYASQLAAHDDLALARLHGLGIVPIASATSDAVTARYQMFIATLSNAQGSTDDTDYLLDALDALGNRLHRLDYGLIACAQDPSLREHLTAERATTVHDLQAGTHLVFR
jgi:hypothetical protein